jgi:SNF2 family DNA or RNA helicase
MDLLQEGLDGGHKILLFSQFTTMLDRIRARLVEKGIASYTLTGQTPKKERLELAEAFNQDDVGVFLISLKAGGTGLNLAGADMVIHYDPWWNIAAQNQATDRAHRIGQKNSVHVLKLIVKNTIEENILKLQEKKRQLADQIIGAEDMGFGALQLADFIELLG